MRIAEFVLNHGTANDADRSRARLSSFFTEDGRFKEHAVCHAALCGGVNSTGPNPLFFGPFPLLFYLNRNKTRFFVRLIFRIWERLLCVLYLLFTADLVPE